jgi:hypothetical protein
VTITADLEGFVKGHRSHGHLASDIGDLTANGYRLAVACSCGVTFHRWITPREAAEDLAVLVELAEAEAQVSRALTVRDSHHA